MVEFRRKCLAMSLFAVLAGCSDSNKGTGDDMSAPNNNTQQDMGSDVASAADQFGDADNNGVGVVADCSAGATDAIITVDAQGRSGQFYSSAAFDGNATWVVYNRPESETVDDEAMFVARIACDGTFDVEPLQISESSSDRRNYHPAIVAHDGRVHVVWVSQPNDANPKAIKYMWFRADGTPGLIEPADVTPTGQFDPVSETIWELDIAAYSTGATVVASAGGAEWQAVAQRFGFDGLRVGPAFYPFPNKGVNQTRPTITARPDGELFIAWTRYVPADTVMGTPEDPDRTVMVSIPAGATEAEQTAPFPAAPLSGKNTISRFAKDPGPDGELFLAFQVQTDTTATIAVRDGSRFDTVTNTTVGTQGYINFRPSVAASADGGAVAWFRYRASPINNEVVIQGFTSENGGFANLPAVDVPVEAKAIPPNGPGLAQVSGSTYAVTWSDGETAPQARVKLRFVNVR